MAKNETYWISDGGHGWLAVLLEAYPTAIDYGSGYGYMDNTYVYLEEDLEAVAFLRDHPQVADANGRGELVEKYYEGDAPIRRLERNYDILDTAAFSARLAAENSLTV